MNSFGIFCQSSIASTSSRCSRKTVSSVRRASMQESFEKMSSEQKFFLDEFNYWFILYIISNLYNYFSSQHRSEVFLFGRIHFIDEYLSSHLQKKRHVLMILKNHVTWPLFQKISLVCSSSSAAQSCIFAKKGSKNSKILY